MCEQSRVTNILHTHTHTHVSIHPSIHNTHDRSRVVRQAISVSPTVPVPFTFVCDPVIQNECITIHALANSTIEYSCTGFKRSTNVLSSLLPFGPKMKIILGTYCVGLGSTKVLTEHSVSDPGPNHRGTHSTEERCWQRRVTSAATPSFSLLVLADPIASACFFPVTPNSASQCCSQGRLTPLCIVQCASNVSATPGSRVKVARRCQSPSELWPRVRAHRLSSFAAANADLCCSLRCSLASSASAARPSSDQPPG